MKEQDRQAFDEYISSALLALSGLMTTKEVCTVTKHVAKINRFKQWLYAIQAATIEPVEPVDPVDEN